MMVAKKPATRCQSIWQWKAQARARNGQYDEDLLASRSEIGGGRGLIWIVCSEAIGEVSSSIDLHHVAANGCFGCSVGSSAVWTRVGRGALYHLEVVPVSVDRMATGVVVVDDYFDYVVMVHDGGVCRVAIDGGIGGLLARAQDCVESGDFWCHVSNIVHCKPRVGCQLRPPLP